MRIVRNAADLERISRRDLCKSGIFVVSKLRKRARISVSFAQFLQSRNVSGMRIVLCLAKSYWKATLPRFSRLT